MKTFACVFACVALAWFAPAITAQAGMQPHQQQSPEQLGKVSFPVSCAPGSQKPFERGVALLHSFEYEQAEKQFGDIARRDARCAMAHWGIAMSLFHQIWERPEKESLARGWEEIAAAQKIGAKTGRETGYIAALAAFYRNGTPANYLPRATAYSQAMARLYQQYPDDVEAGAFYALSLLAAQPPDDTSLAAEKKAVAVLTPLFERQPDHPGLAHYIIHACDSPQLAQTGLAAARRYADIASSSAHAVHMPSHIFARLGLWQEDIRANLKSVAIAHPAAAMYMHGHELHAMHFLVYAYVQTGQDEAARRIVEQALQMAAAVPAGDDTGMMSYYGLAAADFPALYALEMHRWADAAALEPAPGAPAHLRMITYWARTIGAARLGDVNAARSNAQKYGEMEQATRSSKYAYLLDGPDVSGGEVRAWLAFAEKRNDLALGEMTNVADVEDRVGKGEVAIPAREMLADMLLALDQPDRALAEYEQSMKTDPNRFNGLAGAARAAELLHQPARASSYYSQLLRNCADGKSSTRPELTRAKAVLAGDPHDDK